MATPVAIEGLAPLRKSLRAYDKEALKELQSVTKRAAEIVAAEARTRAPHGTRPIPASRRPHVRLADSIKATTSGNSGIVRSALPYSKVTEFGGTISPKGTPITIQRSMFVHEALDAKQEEVGKALAEGFDDLATRQGWK